MIEKEEVIPTPTVEVTMTSAYEDLQRKISFLEEVADSSKELKDKFNLRENNDHRMVENSAKGRESSNMAEALQNSCDVIDMLTARILLNINYLSEKLG